MLDKLTSADFAQHTHDTFMLSLGPWDQAHDAAAHGEPLALELIEVKALQAVAQPAQRAPFSLIFRAAAGAYVPQRTYALEHVALGRLAIFLVPIGPDQHGMCYQAIFN